MKQIRIWQQDPPGWTPTFKIVPLEPPTYVLVDDDDYEWLSEYQWYVILDGRRDIDRKEGKYNFPNPRCIITPGDTKIGGRGAQTKQMNRMIIERHGGVRTRYVLQKDGDQLNNQRDNLVCSNSNRVKSTETTV